MNFCTVRLSNAFDLSQNANGIDNIQPFRRLPFGMRINYPLQCVANPSAPILIIQSLTRELEGPPNSPLIKWLFPALTPR